MPDEVTDKQVEQARDRVEKLRERLAEAQTDATVRQTSNDNAVYLAQIEAEEERLKAELEQARAVGKASAQRAAVRDQIETIQEGPDVNTDTPAASTTKE